MTDKCKCSVFTKAKLSFKKVAWTQSPLTLFSLLLFRSNPIHEKTLSTCVLVPDTQRYFLASLANNEYSSFLALHESREFLSASKGTFNDGLLCLED